MTPSIASSAPAFSRSRPPPVLLKASDYVAERIDGMKAHLRVVPKIFVGNPSQLLTQDGFRRDRIGSECSRTSPSLDDPPRPPETHSQRERHQDPDRPVCRAFNHDQGIGLCSQPRTSPPAATHTVLLYACSSHAPILCRISSALSGSLTQGVFEFFYRFHEIRQKVR